MGPTEHEDYGWKDDMSFEEELYGPVHNYLTDRRTVQARPRHCGSVFDH